MKGEMKLSVKKGGNLKEADLQAVWEELESIKENNVGGILETEDVWAYAKDTPDSKISSYVEWNQGRAAKQFQLIQIRSVINSIMIELIEPEGKTSTIHYHINAAGTDDGARGYMTSDEIKKDPERTQQKIAQAFSSLASWCRSYRMFDELAPIVSYLEGVLEKNTVDSEEATNKTLLKAVK